MLAGVLLPCVAVTTGAVAKEGMFTPEQLPLIAKDLKATGLAIPAESLSDLTDFPMGAIVSLGGCSASFVSDKGLAVTNHHCARGSVQYNSSPEHNYLRDGFLARTMDEELPAAPGTRMWVTVEFSDVTDKVTGALAPELTGKARYDAIERNVKALIADCESDENYRCSVPSFYNGLEYKLIKQLEIRDVRIAYAPADAVGKYGGDIDNWMWPRHTGDFSFYRAYVGPDGKPADFSEDNVPYTPAHMLKVSAAGLGEGDFVMAAGYPGSTNRYALYEKVDYYFNWLYPTYVDLMTTWIDAIESASEPGSDARIIYEAQLAGLNNFLKNTKGQLEGAKRVGLLPRRKAREDGLKAWLKQNGKTQAIDAIAALENVERESAQLSRQSFWYNNLRRAQLLSAAQTLYRYALERQKPDAEREPGFQERDADRLKERMQRLDRRFDATVDKAVWQTFITLYRQSPDNALAAFDNALGLTADTDAKAVSDILDSFYANTRLNNAEVRLDWLNKDVADFRSSDDPFIKLALALYDTDAEIEKQQKMLEGEEARLQPEYMGAIIDWQAATGSLAYPDANSTLRVTYGTVLGGSPKDGLIYEPFTRLEGILEKDTGDDPFNAPAKQLNLIKDKQYGPYKLDAIGSVPVNFLTDLDSTGGNSGSATLNDKAELVGLLFDGTFESVNSDWDFDPRTTRTIHVDTRYMLWVMKYLDGAQNLIDEMTIVTD
ncbi:S46 family peptidase [Alteromonas sp. CYL-A6]|uniref:S46 family peptidase n=1 Tax=Alteromonas nitratireducens TaxID=3390813 RepID=UPI0034AD34CC